MDATGKTIISLRFEEARQFAESLAPVKISGRYGFIDKTGSVVVPAQFEDARQFSK
jgi:hypothetical protein